MPLTPVLTQRFETERPWLISNDERLDGYRALRTYLGHIGRHACPFTSALTLTGARG